MTTKQNKMPQMIDLFVSLQIQCCYFCIFSSTDRCWDYSLVLPPLLSSIYKPFPQFSQCSINLTLLKLTPGTSRLEYIITIKINIMQMAFSNICVTIIIDKLYNFGKVCRMKLLREQMRFLFKGVRICLFKIAV